MKPLLRSILIGLGASLLAACGGGGGGNDAVETPTAQARAAQASVEIGDTVELDGSASSSPRGGTLTYQWALAARPANSSAELSSTSAASPSFVADKPGTYTIDLIVNDGTASSAPARVTVTATSPYPVASAPAQINVLLGTDTVGLDGTASTPPTGKSGPLTYLWTLRSAPAGSGAALLDWDQGNATLVVDVEGEYLLHLVVGYDGVDSEPATVTVTVAKGNAPPVAVADPVTVKLGEEVVLDGSASYDPDGQALQYRWRFASPGTGGTIVPIYTPYPEIRDANTAKARFTPVAPGDYQVLFFVYDGTWQSEQIKVNVTVEKPDTVADNKPIVGKLVASGYYPSTSVGEQELGLRADFGFEGYDPEGEPLQFVSAELVSKPAGSAAVLEERFPGLGYPTLQKIQKLDVLGDYKVRMTVSDGVNQTTSEATMRARIGGINNRPLAGGIAPAAASVIAGQALIFQAGTGTRDPDGDPLTYRWTLRDKPDGSKAKIEPVLDPDSEEYRWARVVTDVPGVYIANLELEDDRGMKSAGIAEASGMAKLQNNAPVIRRVAWDMLTIRPDDQPLQLLPCMNLTFTPVVVDPDGDKIYTRRELISKPQDGVYGQNKDVCGHNNFSFTVPGTYVFRYLISDGIAELPEYDHTIEIEPMAQATGVLLSLIYAPGSAAEMKILHAWPYSRLSPRERDGASSTGSTQPQVYETLHLTAVDGNYTIVDVQGEHLNGTTLTPYFQGVDEGQVINQGETLEVKLTAPGFHCLRDENTLYEGFRWRFRIKEIPDATFVHEYWKGAILNNGATPWPTCPAV